MSYSDPYGLTSEYREESLRQTLYAHTPARLSYRVVVPPAGRLDLALGVLRPTNFKITLQPDGGDAETVLDESSADPRRWGQRSVDLSRLEGRTVTLSLEANADPEGQVALWAAPTLSGARRTNNPNILFYVIDGGGADFMSVYSYNRRTTPYMEQLAEQGAVFERAHSNSTRTPSSTASFMTSLQHSVLGGLSPEMGSSPVPQGSTTMAEHLHAAGYQTASFTTNPNAGRLIGLQRGVDVLGERHVGNTSASSIELHKDFWRWREAYPGEPYWVHFQTTDVHPPYRSVPPFAGRYVSPEQRAELSGWDQQIVHLPTSVFASYREELARLNIDVHTYYDRQRGVYDEAMAHQDYQLGRLVARLKATGAWQRTLLIIAADHGHPAGSHSRFGRGLLDPEPPDWEGALLGSFNTRVPLIFVWPGRIPGGQRFSEPVSMIDVLPTILDLIGLPPPDVMQGKSLAPLLLGKEGWEPRPVILDEFRVDGRTGEMIGNIEMIDARWGASLEIGPVPDGADPRFGRHVIPAGGTAGAFHPYFPEVPRLLLYDLSIDPLAVHSVNDLYPDLVEKYTQLLQAQWEAHRALAQDFQKAEGKPFTPEQIRSLRSLGYIR